LSVGVVRSLSETEEDIVEPEFPGVVETDLICPETKLVISSYTVRKTGKTYHTPERDEYSNDIRNTKHPFGLDLEMPLDIPENITRESRGSSLRETEVR